MITKIYKGVKNKKGVKIPNARAREGWGKGIYLFSLLKIGGSLAKWTMRAGKKKKGCGENEFLPACLPAEGGLWGGSVSAIPALAGRQNRKIFVSLIEKIVGGAQLKDIKKIFLFCSRLWRGRKCWAGFLPVRAEILAQKRFALRSVIATNLNIANFAGSLFARSPRLRRGFARIFPYISAQNQRAFENQKSVFCPAGGGSELQSNSQMKFVSNFFHSAESGTQSKFFNPALCAVGAMAKGDIIN